MRATPLIDGVHANEPAILSATITTSAHSSAPFTTKVKSSPSNLATSATSTTTTALQTIATSEDSPYRTFTLFPKLPLELRREIWIDTFPEPQRVELLRLEALHNPNNSIERIHRARDIFNSGARQSFPVSLLVNQESRAETLRHYVIVLNSDGKNSPYFMNPNRDYAYLANCSLNLFQELTWEKSCWLSELGADAAAKHLSKLGSALVDFHTALLKPKLMDYILQDHKECCKDFKQDDSQFCCLFGILPGLNRINVVVHTDDIEEEEEASLSQSVLNMALFLRTILEPHRAVFTSGLLPKVSIVVKLKSGHYVEALWNTGRQDQQGEPDRPSE